MESFVTQPGVPLLTFSNASAGSAPVAQSRFFLAQNSANAQQQNWTVPVCIKSATKPICRVLAPAETTLPIPADASLPVFFANAAAKGYYRTQYTPTQLAAITTKAETTLTPTERIVLLGDTWALTRSDQNKVGDFLSLVLALKQDPNNAVLETALSKIHSINNSIASDEDRTRLAAILRRELNPVYTALGNPKKHESFDRQQLRATLFEALGEAKDPTILAQASQLTTRVFSGSKPDKSVDPALADIAVTITATTGDATYYEKTLALSKDQQDPTIQSDALRLLTHFQQPIFVNRTLDYAVSGEVRNQDSWILLAILLQQRETRDQAWDYIRSNWPKVQAQFTTNSGVRVVAATGSFCTQKQRDEVTSFFSTHPVEASERTLAKSLDSIDACIQLRAAQQPNLRQWLATQPN
jgi:aminopeptidase N/puromycin-sensitive aminopeptidase